VIGFPWNPISIPEVPTIRRKQICDGAGKPVGRKGLDTYAKPVRQFDDNFVTRLRPIALHSHSVKWTALSSLRWWWWVQIAATARSILLSTAFGGDAAGLE
jgi:hypothetical protein